TNQGKDEGVGRPHQTHHELQTPDFSHGEADIRKEQERNIVACPFCGARYIRAFAMHYLRGCSCGAHVVCETSRD
ncbi:hypothetical protein KEJ25_05740, partial [Candidatus Bathyarchaeota archaeon]|nr:hypothetical protein [Candidatus Bathyarchaeota archaeon]